MSNPTGIGGLGEHPENINAGGRPKNQERYGYWLDFFKNLSEEDFKKYRNNKKDMNMAELAAYARIAKTITDLKEFQEVANRTEGMPKQTIKNEYDDEVTEIEVKIVRNNDEIPDNGNESI